MHPLLDTNVPWDVFAARHAGESGGRHALLRRARCSARFCFDVAVNVYDLARALPDIGTLRDRCRAIAMIEAIVSPAWEQRYYSFDAHWADGEEMASMRNGSGDAYSIVFSPAGAFVRGLDHESTMSPANTGHPWPGLVETAPAVFSPQISEPAFSHDGMLDATFCLWRQPEDEAWKAGAIEFPEFSGPRDDPDGSSMMTILCTAGPDTYLAFAADYYGIDIDMEAARQIWQIRPLDDDLVAAVNIELTLADVRGDADEIGYPSA